MPRVSKLSATNVQEFGPVTDRREEMNGYTVEFVSFSADADLDGPLQALPGGACQCPHWGYVIAGRVRFTSGDREEVYEAGDAFYQPPGHRP
ncbi:cupin domain-containing protein, partial [Streptomyces sp. NPDC047000]|uniref:cupin domain-containing protein n=1 Tax=Streptomyces sp. NPDC047000 TaxID=3155474 RepID=UPI0033C34DD3